MYMKYFRDCVLETPALKCFKFVERKSRREMLRVALNDASLTTSVFSGTISKLCLNVSHCEQIVEFSEDDVC